MALPRNTPITMLRGSELNNELKDRSCHVGFKKQKQKQNCSLK